jgi:hypothetical protein
MEISGKRIVIYIAAYFLLCGIIASIWYPYAVYRILNFWIFQIAISLSIAAALLLSIRRYRATEEKELPRWSRVWRIARPFLLVVVIFGFFCLGPCVLVLMDEEHQRQRYNQSNAMSQLMNYVAAQSIFREHFPEKATNVDNFRNLYYGKSEEGEQLRLISSAMADASLRDNFLGNTPTIEPGDSTPAKPYNGYYFIEDPSGLLPASEYADRFALMAIPTEYLYGGFKIFWINEDYSLHAYDPEVEWGTTAEQLLELFLNKPDSTPLADQPCYDWTVYP